jgi:hypothetical protein
MTDADWRARSGAYRDRAHELGKQPFIVAMRDGWVADSFEEASREFGSHFIRSARFYVRHGLLQHPDFPTEADVTAASLAPHLTLGGSRRSRIGARGAGWASQLTILLECSIVDSSRVELAASEQCGYRG